MKFKKELEEELDSLNLTEAQKDKAQIEVQRLMEETGYDYDLCLSVWEADNGYTTPFSIKDAERILFEGNDENNK